MKYPIGIQDFEKLRTNGYSYVDKSRFVYKLATEGEYYFLSRPRRFGKSLFLSTLEAYFQGKKELFEGLAIYDLEAEWKKYPIFHIDLNTANFREKDSLYTVLNDYLTTWESKYGARESGDKELERKKEIEGGICYVDGKRGSVLWIIQCVLIFIPG